MSLKKILCIFNLIDLIVILLVILIVFLFLKMFIFNEQLRIIGTSPPDIPDVVVGESLIVSVNGEIISDILVILSIQEKKHVYPGSLIWFNSDQFIQILEILPDLKMKLRMRVIIAPDGKLWYANQTIDIGSNLIIETYLQKLTGKVINISLYNH